MFQNDGELKIVTFYPNTKLGILFAISGQTTLFFNQFVHFPNFLRMLVILYCNQIFLFEILHRLHTDFKKNIHKETHFCHFLFLEQSP